ncbi:hypothetical protein SDC9_87392 [bioreactor metagenome]|uniref:Uncharacterized protein n=1 Tax=bioreactor metagenome TaxID=1076179 RepID=A0A644ZT50_9ZZZZ
MQLQTGSVLGKLAVYHRFQGGIGDEEQADPAYCCVVGNQGNGNHQPLLILVALH